MRAMDPRIRDGFPLIKATVFNIDGPSELHLQHPELIVNPVDRYPVSI